MANYSGNQKMVKPIKKKLKSKERKKETSQDIEEAHTFSTDQRVSN